MQMRILRVKYKTTESVTKTNQKNAYHLLNSYSNIAFKKMIKLLITKFH